MVVAWTPLIWLSDTILLSHVKLHFFKEPFSHHLAYTLTFTVSPSSPIILTSDQSAKNRVCDALTFWCRKWTIDYRMQNAYQRKLVNIPVCLHDVLQTYKTNQYWIIGSGEQTKRMKTTGFGSQVSPWCEVPHCGLYTADPATIPTSKNRDEVKGLPRTEPNWITRGSFTWPTTTAALSRFPSANFLHGPSAKGYQRIPVFIKV